MIVRWIGRDQRVAVVELDVLRPRPDVRRVDLELNAEDLTSRPRDVTELESERPFGLPPRRARHDRVDRSSPRPSPDRGRASRFSTPCARDVEARGEEQPAAHARRRVQRERAAAGVGASASPAAARTRSGARARARLDEAESARRTTDGSRPIEVAVALEHDSIRFFGHPVLGSQERQSLLLLDR